MYSEYSSRSFPMYAQGWLRSWAGSLVGAEIDTAAHIDSNYKEDSTGKYTSVPSLNCQFDSSVSLLCL
jgi:hypothetical protein